VTGASRGLGRAITLGLARAGADVVLSSRKAKACRVVADQVEALGRQAHVHACHVGHWDEIDGLVDAAYERFDRVDVLVNNAGLSPLYPDPQSVTEDLWDKVLGVNLKGPFRLTALVGARMTEGDGGSVVNISSVGSLRPTGDAIPYSAAKAGLNALTIAYADALGPKVRVNAILPGPFLTDVSRAWDMERFEQLAAGYPLRRAAEPDEIVGAVLYFASAAGSYTTGAVLTVDGGSMWGRVI
jgi:NAD(P)-dependent dehydrogenase (short-subunit alcohol dehydrogenase family)